MTINNSSRRRAPARSASGLPTRPPHASLHPAVAARALISPIAVVPMRAQSRACVWRGRWVPTRIAQALLLVGSNTGGGTRIAV